MVGVGIECDGDMVFVWCLYGGCVPFEAIAEIIFA